MIVTVTAQVEKQCPYRNEKDYGTAVLTFAIAEGDAPELHDLAKQLSAGVGEAVSHEEYTRALLATWAHKGLIHARTTWQTAGLEVSVDVPDRSR